MLGDVVSFRVRKKPAANPITAEAHKAKNIQVEERESDELARMPFEDGDARDLKTFKSRSENGGKLAMPDFED